MCLNKDDNQALSWIQGQLNHSSQDITLRYVGFDEDKAKEYYKKTFYGVNTHSLED